jgi:serine/threonine protein kinase/Tol biopolymer transport system component
MPLAAGSRIGPYEIRVFLGRGGMGEVYSARDERLGRTVAIKILREDVAEDPERMRRLEQEARAASALNHPHIVTIHEFGTTGGLSYIVMEYVEGTTLRDRLSEGTPLDLRVLLDLSAQIALGLAAAHDRGIVHRDLKPENIMLARSGFAKIVDFGLASVPPPVDEGVTVGRDDPTGTAHPTFVGTYQYMSPEQVRGGRVTVASDQFSLAVVLYEMATGRHPFRRADRAETTLAIQHDPPPPLASQRADLPAPFRWAVERCLSKDPRARFASTLDLARDLQCVRDNRHELDAHQDKSSPIPAWWPWLAAAAAVGVMALAAGGLRRGQPEAAAVTFSVPPPPGASFNFSGSDPAPLALSPDGRLLAFGARDLAGKTLLWLRPLTELAARPLAGTEGATYPFWSPDSRDIAFFAQGELKRVSVADARISRICGGVSQARGGSWNRDGLIVFASGEGPLQAVPAAGGAPTPIASTSGHPEGGWPRWPTFLPDGRRVLYMAATREEGTPFGIHAASLRSSESRLLVSEASNAAYASGRLLFIRDGNLVAAPFDPDELRITGPPSILAPSVHSHHYRLNSDFSASETGVVAYYGGEGNRSHLEWYDRRGRALHGVGKRAAYGGFRISPDGSRCAVEIRNPRTSGIDIWIMDVERGLETRLTAGTAISDAPTWAPDGTRILFTANPGGVWDLYLRALAGTGADELVHRSKFSKIPTDWSRDGRYIAYDEGNDQPTGNVDIWMLPLPEGSAQPWLATPFRESKARFSWDGRAVAYVSDEAGRPEVYVRSFPEADARIRVSGAGGDQPLWSRSGELFYVSADDKLMAVPVATRPRLQIGTPAALFELRLAPSATDNPRYGLSADGQRILANVRDPSEEPGIVVRLSWTGALKP